jgi:hypothetical protein
MPTRVVSIDRASDAEDTKSSHIERIAGAGEPVFQKVKRASSCVKERDAVSQGLKNVLMIWQLNRSVSMMSYCHYNENEKVESQAWAFAQEAEDDTNRGSCLDDSYSCA